MQGCSKSTHKSTNTLLAVMSVEEVKEGRKAGTRCIQWALKTACLAYLTYIILQWLALMPGQQRLHLPGWLLARHSPVVVVAWTVTAAVLMVVLLLKLIFVAKVSLKLLLGFTARRPSDWVIANDDHRGQSPFSSAGGNISQRTTMSSSGAGAVAGSLDAGGNLLSFGFELSKAAQDMLRCSAGGAVKAVNAMLPHAWMNSASGRLSGGEEPPDLLEAPFSGSTQKVGRSPPTAVMPVNNYGSNRSSGLWSSMPMPGTHRRLTDCLSSNSVLCVIREEVKQAYSEVPEHYGRFLVLHVNKDPIDQSVVTLLLESGHKNAKQFKVGTARCGGEALEMIFSSRYLPDIVLMDTMLPDMKASKVCETLRASFSPTELAIVLTTGRSGESDALAALDNGVNDFIIKPLRQLELLARINNQIKVKQCIKREAESRSHYDLLVQVLPPHIIARLSLGQAYAPEHHDQVTILFSDIVSFTDLCSKWPTQQVVTMLDIMFSCFDDLCDKHGAFKVETIGDAYMVASGHEGSPDHAVRLAEMAVDMLESMQGLEERIGASVRIRIGMHTGPALSGVVGKRRPRYCFFGDTVNTASRMESTGHPMTIQISDVCRRSMLAAAGPITTDSDAAVTVQRRPAPAVVPVADVHKSEFFLSTSPKGSRSFNEAFSRISPPHGSGPQSPTPFSKTSLNRRSRRGNSSRHNSFSSGNGSNSQQLSLEMSQTDQQQAVATSSAGRVSPEELLRSHSSDSKSGSQRPSHEMSRTDQQHAVPASSASRGSPEKLSHSHSSGSKSGSQRPSHEAAGTDQQQAVPTVSASRLSPEKPPHNSMIATTLPAETTRNGIKEESGEGASYGLPSESESDCSTESSDSASSSQVVRHQLVIQGCVVPKPRSGGIADSEALEAAAGSQSHIEVVEASEAKTQGPEDPSLPWAVFEERHPGLPWSILNLGHRSVKGKGYMETHLLKVGSWQQSVLAVKAEQEANKS